jgi:hypothetical protein
MMGAMKKSGSYNIFSASNVRLRVAVLLTCNSFFKRI